MNPADLLAALRGIPNLHGAACTGLWPAFDAAEPDETAEDTEHRHNTAIRVCNNCPALQPCRQWFDGLRPSQRPAGVIAGLVSEPRSRRKAAS